MPLSRWLQHIRRTVKDYRYPYWVLRDKVRQHRADRAFIKKYLAHLGGNADPPLPVSMNLLISEVCNLSCIFCEFKTMENPRIMALDSAEKIIDAAHALGVKELNITGGEPLTHPDIIEIMDKAYRKGLFLLLSTNGMLLERYAEKLGRFKDAIYVSVSIDGMEELHDELRDRKGAFQRAIGGIESLKRYLEGDKIEITFVATNRNLHQVIDAFKLSRDLGIYFNLNPVQGQRDFYPRLPCDIKRYREAIAYLRSRDYRVARNWFYYRFAPLYWSSPRLPVRCGGLAYSFGVDVMGNLKPCCVWEYPHSVGNLLSEDILDLWRSPDALMIRRSIFEGKCPIGCYNITYLRDFMRITTKRFIPEPQRSVRF